MNLNFIGSDGADLGSKLISKDYLISIYPNIANHLVTPELWVWGANFYGELGRNIGASSRSPITTFAGGSNWKSVSCETTTAAIKTDGTLWVWGDGRFGQIANNLSGSVSTPVTTFAGGNDWKQVSTSSFVAAIKNDGTLWIWGYNFNGPIGDNTNINRSTPVTTFAGGNDWKQVSAGPNNSVGAIKDDGTLWVWGSGSNGQLGINSLSTKLTPVTTFAGGNDWKQVSFGVQHVAAIKTDGSLWIWGSNTNGQLGTNNILQSRTPVTTFAGGNDWKQVSAGNSHTSAIKTDGTLWVWGRNNRVQLGTNNTTDRSTPVTTFAGGTNWKQVSSRSQHTAAIKTDGSLWIWGYNFNTQLGTNDTINKSTPVTTFAGGNNWKIVDTRTDGTIAIKSIRGI